MQKRRKAACKRPQKKNGERTAPDRCDWIVIGLCITACFAMLPAFFLHGTSRALLYYCVPVYAMLERAAPTPAPAPSKKPVPSQASAPPRMEAHIGEPATLPVAANADKEAPRILIYHTHATEAYLPTDNDAYVPSGKWRTEDAEKSVVAVGTRLCALLEGEYGLAVLHDTTNFEPPKLSSAYSRSLLAMQGHLERYPTIRIFIDVHRDAYGSGKELVKAQDYIELDGKETARLMFVVGTGEGATGAGFSEKPDFRSNLAFAQAVTERLRAGDERLVRNVRVKTGRYNQHVSNACLLVEVGHNANTLEQALNAVPYLAEAIAACVETEPLPEELAALSVWSPQKDS